MAQNEFLDALSPEAEKRLKAYGAEIDKLVEKIGKASTVQIGGRTPSGTESAIKKLQEDALKTEAAIKSLQQTYIKAANDRKAANIQERVDNSIILQQQKQQATIVSEVAGAYKRLSAQQAQAATNVQNIIARGRLATQTQRQYNAEIARAQKEFDGLNNRVRKADEAVGRFQRNVGNYPKILGNVNQLLGALGVSLGAAGVVTLAKNIFDTTKQLQSLDLALKSVTGSEQAMRNEQTFLNEIAQKYGLEIKNLTSLYTSFYVAAKDKLAAGEIRQIFEDISQSGSALGLSNEALQRSFVAVNQMLSKGVVSAEELRGQLAESLPGAVQALLLAVQKLHPELKVMNERDLFDLIKQGRILSAEVLPEMSKQLLNVTGADKTSGIDTLTKSVNRLSNEWTDLVRTLNENESGGITQFFNFFIDGATEAIKVLSQLNKGVKALRDDAAGSSKASLSSFYGTLPDENARRKTAEIDRKNALEWIARYNQELGEANRTYELFNKVSLLNFSPDRVAMLNKSIEDRERLNLALGVQRGRLQAANEVLNANTKATKANAEMTKDQLKAIEDAKRDKYDTRLAELQLEQQVIDRTLNDEEQFYSTRIAALDKHFNKRIEIISLMYEEEVRRAGKSQDKQKQALIKFHSESLKEIENYKDKREQLESLQLQPEDVVDTYDNEAEMKKMHEKTVERLDREVEAIERIKEAYKQAEKSMRDYANTFVESVFNDAQLPTLFDIMSDKIVGFGVDATTTALAITEAFQEMYNFLNTASSENFDLERDNLEKKYQIDRLFAGENQAALAELEKEAEARRKEIARREAKSNKELATFNIAMNAAQGIVAAFKDGNVIKGAVFAALIAGIAAVQIAAINSQSIPSYWKGTENHPGGLMRVNDRGLGKELIQTPDGKNYIAKGNDAVVNAPKGTKVKTAQWTREHLMFDNGLNNILNERGISMQPVQNVNNNVNMDIDRLAGRIDAAIARIPQTTLALDHPVLGSILRPIVNGNVSHNSRKYQKPIKYSR